MNPDEAITKAYEESLALPEKMTFEKYFDEHDECPMCLDERSDGTCYCSTTSHPPCGYCEYQCDHNEDDFQEWWEDNK